MKNKTKVYKSWKCSVENLLNAGGTPYWKPGFFVLKSESGNSMLAFKPLENQHGMLMCIGVIDSRTAIS